MRIQFPAGNFLHSFFQIVVILLGLIHYLGFNLKLFANIVIFRDCRASFYDENAKMANKDKMDKLAGHICVVCESPTGFIRKSVGFIL